MAPQKSACYYNYYYYYYYYYYDDDDDDDGDGDDLDYMSSTVDLSGIEVIDADRRFIRQAHKDVELQAHKMLEQGIESQVHDVPL